jgi:hypothetical protein
LIATAEAAALVDSTTLSSYLAARRRGEKKKLREGSAATRQLLFPAVLLMGLSISFFARSSASSRVVGEIFNGFCVKLCVSVDHPLPLALG